MNAVILSLPIFSQLILTPADVGSEIFMQKNLGKLIQYQRESIQGVVEAEICDDEYQN
jgi:hypothetical protein